MSAVASIIFWAAIIVDLVLIWSLWRANRQTSLSHAVAWGIAAWLAWVGVFLADDLGNGAPTHTGRYVALCFTSAAGVAVLGARRPGVGAWNFVVAGLLAVLLLPIAEGRGEVHASAPQQ